jgi:NAD(P)-dependent dehydrogenase (short-subunit alcohol dehydrogenase family)
MSKKDPETAIVTGASRCIGAAVAERPAGDGFDVVINYAGEHGSAPTLVARIQRVGWSAMVHQADVSDAEADDASFDRHVAINLNGAFNGFREASEWALREDRAFGRLIPAEISATEHETNEYQREGAYVDFVLTVSKFGQEH